MQLLRLSRAFGDCELVFVTVHQAYRADVQEHRFYSIPDATRRTWIELIRAALRVFVILYKERPDVIVSTGAAPGYVAIRIGKLLGAKTVWLDSVANIEQLSMSGALAGQHADLWLTQWPHLAREGGPHFRGAVL